MILKREAKIGLLFIISICSIYFGSLFLKQASFISNRNEYFFSVEEAQGLDVGSKILYKGLVVGRVSKVEFFDSESMRIKITVKIDKNISLTNNSTFRINSSLIPGIGTSTINLEIEKGEKLKLNSEVKAELDQKLQEMIAPTIKNAGDLLLLTNKFLIDIAKNTESISKIFFNLEKTTEQVNRIISRNEKNFLGISDSVHKIVNTLNNPKNGIGEFMGQLNILLKNINSETTLNLLKNISDISIKVDSILEKIINSEGSLSKLLNSNEFHDELVATTKSGDLLLKNMKNNPSRYVSFSLFKFGKS